MIGFDGTAAYDKQSAKNDMNEKTIREPTHRNAAFRQPSHDGDLGGKAVRIGIIVVEGGLNVAGAGLLDLFAIANRWSRTQTGKSTRIFDVSILGQEPVVRSFTGHPFPTDDSLEDWNGDVTICSAFATEPQRALSQNQSVVAWLANQGERTVASVCTGAFFLAEAGLLDGHRATTNPLFESTFVSRYPRVELDSTRVVIEDRSRLTSGTVSAALNLGLLLIERYAGVTTASLTARSMAVDKNRELQTAYRLPSPRVAEKDELIGRVQQWLEARHADSEIDLSMMANAHGTTPRTLQRRFLAAMNYTPVEYLQRVRIESAKYLLETTRLSVDEITWKVGYRNTRSFVRLFAERAHVTPTEYRKRFGKILGDR